MQRSLLTNPGEQLVGTIRPSEMGSRLVAFQEFSGLDAEHILAPHLATIPLPLYPASWDDENKRWTGIKPEAMWHPLFWLPVRLYGRYMLVNPDTQEEALETDEEWSLRLVLEMTRSRLYDPESGTWRDLLADEGLDIEKEETLQRVQTWLLGGADPVLDRIPAKVDEYTTDADDPNWAVSFVTASLFDFERISWAIFSDEVLFEAQDMERRLALPPEDLYSEKNPEGELAVTLEDIVQLVEIAVDGLFDAPEMEGVSRQWGRMMDQDCSESELLARLIADTQKVRDAYWPMLDEMADTEVTDDAAALFGLPRHEPPAADSVSDDSVSDDSVSDDGVSDDSVSDDSVNPFDDARALPAGTPSGSVSDDGVYNPFAD